MNIQCTLYSDWIRDIRKAMTDAGLDHSLLTDQDCVVRWCAWKRRIVRPAKRTIQKAKGFRLPAKLHKGLNKLEHALISGAEIWPWQSKLIDRPNREDGLYNDYGVIHFHLGTLIERGGYIERTDELLFAVVDSSVVYEIGIYEHGDWYELDILNIIDANWPRLLDPVTISALGVQNNPRTPEEVKERREANINSLIELKSGRIVFPLGGGVALDKKKTSIKAIRLANFWTKILRNGEKKIAADIREQVKLGIMEEKDYKVHLIATDNEVSGMTKEGSHKWILWKKC
jgi:hypothetical protein